MRIKVLTNSRGNTLLLLLVLLPLLGMMVANFSSKSNLFLKTTMRNEDVSEEKISINDFSKVLSESDNCIKTLENIPFNNGSSFSAIKIHDGSVSGVDYYKVGDLLLDTDLELVSMKIDNLSQLNPAHHPHIYTGEINLQLKTQANNFSSSLASTFPVFFIVDPTSTPANKVVFCTADLEAADGFWKKNLDDAVGYFFGAVGVGNSSVFPSSNSGVGDLDVEAFYGIKGQKVLSTVADQASTVLLGYEAGKVIDSNSLDDGGSFFAGVSSGPQSNIRTDTRENSEIAIGYRSGSGHHSVRGSVKGNLAVGAFAAETADAGVLSFGWRAGRTHSHSVDHQGIFIGAQAGASSITAFNNDNTILLGTNAGEAYRGRYTSFPPLFDEGNNIMLGTNTGSDGAFDNVISIGKDSSSIAQRSVNVINIGAATNRSYNSFNSVLVGQSAGGNRFSRFHQIIIGHASFHTPGSNSSHSSAVRNTVIGNEAVQTAASPWLMNNTIIGHESAKALISSNAKDNTIIGAISAPSMTEGERNLIIGHFADIPFNSQNDQLNIGNVLRAYNTAGHNRIHIGSHTTSKKADFIAEGPLGTCTINSSTLCLSDERLKENIKPILSSLDKVLDLKPVVYEWKKTNTKDMGFIAQDVEEVLPEVIVQGKKGLEINYDQLTPFILQAIKEQNKKIQKVKQDCHENDYDNILALNISYERKIKKLKALIKDIKQATEDLK